jgi:hypothetical protein
MSFRGVAISTNDWCALEMGPALHPHAAPVNTTYAQRTGRDELMVALARRRRLHRTRAHAGPIEPQRKPSEMDRGRRRVSAVILRRSAGRVHGARPHPAIRRSTC